MKAALKPGGVLAVLDLYQARTPGDYAVSAAAVPVNWLLTWRNGGHHGSPEADAAWQEHGQSDVYPTPTEVRRVCADLLPGARVTRHLLWRYSLIWRKA